MEILKAMSESKLQNLQDQQNEDEMMMQAIKASQDAEEDRIRKNHEERR